MVHDAPAPDQCLRDIVALSTLPAIWTGSEPVRIAESLAAALFTTLGSEFVYVLISAAQDGPPVAVAQTGRYETNQSLADHLGPAILDWARAHDPDELLPVPNPLGRGSLRVSARPLGLQAEMGVVAAAFSDEDTPTAFQQLVLNVAATQAATAIQHVRLLQSLHESEERVGLINAELAQRVAELEQANREIRDSRRAALNLMEDAIQSQEVLRQSEERFRMLADNMSQLAWTCDQLGNVTWYNKRWLDYTGLTFDEMRDWGWTKCHHPDHVDRVVASVTHSRETGDIWEDTFPLRGKDGQYRWFLSRAYPIRDNEGAIIRWFGTNTDLTEQLMAEKALRESEERFRSLVSVISDVTWTADAAGAFVTPQAEWEAYTGQPWEKHQGFGWVEALDPDDRERIQEDWRGARQSARLYKSHGRLWHAPTGEYRHFTVKATPLINEDGSVRQWVGTCTDVEEQVRIAQERQALLEAERAARSEAERAGRMKDEFLATLSHELRTPLNAILGYAQLLNMAELGKAEVAEAAQTIERNARLQAQLIEDLLDMNRIISGKIRLDVQRLNLPEVIEEAVKTIRPGAEAKGVRVDVLLDTLAVPVRGDPGRIQQIVWNLLSNAVKFTPKGGKVQVLLERVNSHVEITVDDTGSGIAPDFLPYVFDRFRQADASATRRHGGLGLGLAIVKHLVELHGGTIQANSAGEGQGATFTVSLPVMSVVSPDDSTQKQHPKAIQTARFHFDGCDIDLRGVRVLIVDDEPDATRLVKRVLQECKAEVAEATSSEQAFALLSETRFDVMVSDIGMPGEDGYQLIRRVRSLSNGNENVPAIALTAFARSEDRRRSALAGFQTHLSKPVEAPELLAIVANLAGKAGGPSRASAHRGHS